MSAFPAITAITYPLPGYPKSSQIGVELSDPWGYRYTLPLPLVPISKGLTGFLPMCPHQSMLKTKGLRHSPHFLPIMGFRPLANCQLLAADC